MVAFSRTCLLSVRPRAFAISNPPEPLLTSILSALAADLLPLSCGLIDLDLQIMRSVPIFCLPRFVLLHVKFNQPILYLGDESRPLRRSACRSSAHRCLNSNAGG
jgi:hypothetical protein